MSLIANPLRSWWTSGVRRTPSRYLGPVAALLGLGLGFGTLWLSGARGWSLVAAGGAAVSAWVLGRHRPNAPPSLRLSALSHELKNPLTPVRGFARLLAADLSQVDPSARPRFARGLELIAKEAQRIELRLDAAVKHAVEPARSVRVAELFEEVSALVEERPGILRIEQRVDPPELCVWVPEDGLQGVLVNLMVNAADAMSEQPGLLVLVARKRTCAVEISVLDEGSGLAGPPERMFEPFFTTKSGGRGLGLAIAREDVRAMGGRLELRSRAPRGVKACLRVPRSRSAPSTASVGEEGDEEDPS